MREFAENHLQNAAYFNSGILLMNLKNMAKNQQLLLDIKVALKYPDQDILNVDLHKQNYYQYVPHDMYTMFYKHCTALNFYPDEFMLTNKNTFANGNNQPAQTFRFYASKTTLYGCLA